jgi:hypothetical protein
VQDPVPVIETVVPATVQFPDAEKETASPEVAVALTATVVVLGSWSGIAGNVIV